MGTRASIEEWIRGLEQARADARPLGPKPLRSNWRVGARDAAWDTGDEGERIVVHAGPHPDMDEQTLCGRLLTSVSLVVAVGSDRVTCRRCSGDATPRKRSTVERWKAWEDFEPRPVRPVMSGTDLTTLKAPPPLVWTSTGRVVPDLAVPGIGPQVSTVIMLAGCRVCGKPRKAGAVFCGVACRDAARRG